MTSAPSAPPNARHARRSGSCGTRDRAPGDWILIDVTANAFLHHMVRNIVGLLLAIGLRRAPPARAREQLESRQRSEGEATAAAQGLYFWRVRVSAIDCLGFSYAEAFPAMIGRTAHVLVRENRPFAHQDRTALALGPGGTVDQMPGLRRGAVPRRARAQSQRLPQVQPPHAHRRARAAAQPSSTRNRSTRSVRASCPRIRSSSRTASVTGPPGAGAEGHARDTTRWSRCPARCTGSGGRLRVRISVLRRLDGLGGRRAVQARGRSLHRPALRAGVLHRHRRRAHAGGAAVADADGQDQRRAGAAGAARACPSYP